VIKILIYLCKKYIGVKEEEESLDIIKII